MAPTSTKQWTISDTKNGFDGLKFEDVAVPRIGENEVLVKLHAASLNYRDLIIPKVFLRLLMRLRLETDFQTQGLYPFPINTPVAACSDGAGEVVEAGSKVTKWKTGDKVVTLFNQGHQFGPVDVAATKTGLGGVLDGTLRQYGVFSENGLVRQPSNLNALEASTLTCAGLTAWNALYGLKPLKAGDTVLVQGTGGVSIFGLLVLTSFVPSCSLLRLLTRRFVI